MWTESPRSTHGLAFVVAATVFGLGLVASGERPLVDAVVVAGFTVVAPLALGGPRRWAVAGAAVAVALTVDSVVVAVALSLPALGVAVWASDERLRTAGIRTVRSSVSTARSLADVAYVLVPVWAVIGAGSLLASVAEIELFGIGEPIVRLTAVHYLYAGTGALTIAHRTMVDLLPGTRLPVLAVSATGVAPPIVAAGFVLGHPVPQIGGAALMTVGIWVTAALLLSTLRHTSSPGERVLRGLAGLTPWVPMVLAVAWATAQHVPGVPALSVTDMARTHGLANGLGFVILGLLSTRTPTARTAPSPDLEMVG